MNERRERPFESFEEFQGLKQSDIVSFTYNGAYDEGDVKCFKKYLDTGSIMAVVSPTGQSLFHHDIEVEAGELKLKFRMGKTGNPVFKLGKAKKI